jgi:hypothetical protein
MGHQGGEQGMAHLVVGDQPLLGAVLQRSCGEAHRDPLQGIADRLVVDA